MPDVITYNGSDKWKQRATELLNEASGGLVDDVQVNGQSVVTNKVAEIDLTPYALTTDIQTNYYDKTAIDTALADKADIADLATVATSGSYNDLTDQPTIPAAQVNSDWNASSGVAKILNKPSIYTQTETDTLLAAKQNSLLGGNISSGDLNDYRTIGNYYVNSTSVSHLPVSYLGFLEVIPKDTGSTTGMLQRYTVVDNNAISGVYERIYISSAWRAWKQIGEDVFLPLTGGELTGDVTITEASPSMVLKDTSFTVNTSSNNGVTTQQDDYVTLQDNSGAYFGRFRSTAYTDGRIASVVDARNMKSDGQRVANYLAVGVNKDGSRYFAMPNDSDGDARDAFREAIKIGSNSIKSFSDTSLANSSHATLTSISPPNGTYLVIAGVSFANNSTGVRRILLARGSSSTSNPVIVDSDKALIETTVPAASVSSSYTQSVSLTTIATVNSTYPTIYLRAYQNSGAAMTVTGAVQYIRIA